MTRPDNPRHMPDPDQPENESLAHEGGVYRCPVYVWPLAEDRFQAMAVNLLGVMAEGGTEEESLFELTSVLTRSLEGHRLRGEPIPWTPPPDNPPPGAKTRMLIIRL